MDSTRELTQNGADQARSDLRAWAEKQPPEIRKCAFTLADQVKVWSMWPHSEDMARNVRRTIEELRTLRANNSLNKNGAGKGLVSHLAGEEAP